MKKITKRLLSAVISLAMSVSGAYIPTVGSVNVMAAGIETYAENTISVVFKDIPGVGDGTQSQFKKDADLTNGISVYHGKSGLSGYPVKSVNANFNDGEKGFSNADGANNAIQVGNGNEKIPAADVEAGKECPGDVEKGLKIVLSSAADITVYGALSTSGVPEAKFALVDDATYNVVDVQATTRPNGEGTNYYVPKLRAPEAGTYYFFIPGKVTGLNVFEIDITPLSETVEETTVETTCVETTTEATTSAPNTPFVMETGKMYFDASIDGQESDVIDSSRINDTANPVTINFSIPQNVDEGFSSATFFVRYNPKVLQAKAAVTVKSAELENKGYIYYEVKYDDGELYPKAFFNLRTINDQIAAVPNADSEEYADVNPDGTLTCAQLGKIKLAATVDDTYLEGDSIKGVKGTGILFAMTFDVVGEGNADISIETVKMGYPPSSGKDSIPTANVPNGIEVKANYCIGDTDADNYMTANDALILLQKVLKDSFNMPIYDKTDDWMKYSDVNAVAGLTASDAACILQKTLTEQYVMPAEEYGSVSRCDVLSADGAAYTSESSIPNGNMYIKAAYNGGTVIPASKVGDTVDVDFELKNNPGFSAATFFVRYDPSVIRAKNGVSVKSSELAGKGYVYYEVENDEGELAPKAFFRPKTINDQITQVPAANSRDHADVDPDGSKTAAELGKVKLSSTVLSNYTDGNGYLKPVNGDGKLFTMTFDVIGDGDANVYIEGRFYYPPIMGKGSTPIPMANYISRLTVEKGTETTTETATEITTEAAQNTLRVGKVDSVKGAEVEVPIEILGSTGIAALQGELYFDNTVLTPVSIDTESDFSLTSNLKQKNIDKTTLTKITVVCDNDSDITGDIRLATVKFTVKDTADTGSTPLSFKLIKATDENAADVSLSVENGSIRILQIGDIDMDGEINVVDVLLLRQNLAGWKRAVFTDTQSLIADVYKDGLINVKDLVTLRQFVAGYDVTLG